MLDVNGLERSYLLHLPPAAANGHRVPLVLLFHGYQGNGTLMMENSGMNDVADSAGIAVAYPNGTSRVPFFSLAWNAFTCCGRGTSNRVDDIGFSVKLVHVLVAAGLIDSTRVFAAGFSVGGMMALRLACVHPEMFAAAADIAGAMPDTACVPPRPTSVLLVQGDADADLKHDHHFQALRVLHPHRFAVSMENAFDFWSARERCSASISDTATAFHVRRAADCRTGSDVTLFTVHGEAHDWPGGTRIWPFGRDSHTSFNASEEVVRFFDGRSVAPSPADRAAQPPGDQ